jgi:DNA-binding beta-propeller fold protein YncE
MRLPLYSCGRWALGLVVSVGLLLTLGRPARATAPVLNFVEAVFDGPQGAEGLEGATAVVVSPDGKHVYVAAGESDALAVFTRDPATGA